MKTLQLQNETAPAGKDDFTTNNERFIYVLGWTEEQLDIFSSFLERLQQPDFEQLEHH